MFRLKVSKFSIRALLALIALVSMAIAPRVFAASVFVQPPVSDAEDASLKASLHELVKAAVSEDSGSTLASDAKDADFVLKPRLLKLGTSYIVSLDKLQNDKVIFTTNLKTADADELDSVAARVVRAALRETKASEDAEVGDVTETEVTQNTRRIQTTRQWKLGFGPGWGDQMNTEKSGLLFTLGFVWGIDPNFDLDVALRSTSFEKTGETGAHFTEFLIGTNYYLTRGRNAPFLTFGLGRASASVSHANTGAFLNFSDDTVSGWSARVGVGLKFFRTSTVNLGVEANYSKIFADSSVSKKNPGLTSLALALYY